MVRRHLLLAAVLVLATATAGVGLAADREGTFVAVDHGTSLDAPATVNGFESDGIANASVDRIGLDIRVAEQAADAGLSSWAHLDAANTYVRINYSEEIQRTVRIYLPDDYVTPRAKRGLEAENGGPTAKLAPTPERNATALTVTFEESGTATYALGAPSGFVFEARSGVKDVINESVGIEIPRLGGGTQWQYVPAAELTGDNVTQKLGDGALSEYTIQYAATDGNETTWVTVTECDGDQRVCALERSGSVYAFARTEDPPRLRYKRGQDLIARLTAALDDLAAIPGRFLSDLGGLWGGEG